MISKAVPDNQLWSYTSSLISHAIHFFTTYPFMDTVKIRRSQIQSSSQDKRI